MSYLCSSLTLYPSLPSHQTNKTAECSVKLVTNQTVADHCVMSQVSTFVRQMQLNLPFFGVIFYWANWAFIGALIMSALFIGFGKDKDVKKGYRELDDEIW